MSLHFIDTNIFMYAIGSEHPFKGSSEELVRNLSEEKIEGCINTEVLQEVLYRYSSIGKIQIGFKLFDALLETFSRIWPIAKEDLILAKKIQEKFKVKTRDAIHAATMQRNSVKNIYSYDRDFDAIPFICRFTP